VRLLSKIVILGGAGQVGEAALRDLIETSDVGEIIIADINFEAAKKLVDKVKCGYVSPKKTDILNRQEAINVLKGADVVINCTPMFWSVHVIKLALEAKVHYIDFSGDFTLQKELHDEFQKNDLTAVTNMGECPGVIDLMAMYVVDKLDSVENIEAFAADKDFTEGMPDYYFTWSPEGEISFIGSPAFVWKRQKSEKSIPYPKSLFDALDLEQPVKWQDGELVKVPSMSKKKTVQFPEPIGEVEVYLAPHSEQFTFPIYFKDKGLQSVSFWESINWRTVFLYKMGFGSDEPLNVKGTKVKPIDFISALIRKKNMVGFPETVTPDHYEADKIIATGKKNGKDATYIIDIIFPPNKKWKTSGQANFVGIPGSITTQMILNGEIKKRGVFITGTSGIKPEPFFKELAKRDVKFYITGKQQITFA
jgi:lysine 6-dehydrogenase